MSAKKTLEQEYFKTTHLAKLTGLTSQTIRREIKAGKLPAYEFHGEFLIKRKDYEEWKARYFNAVA